MNLRPRRAHQADINLTPLIDVVFLLLIFFMVSTTFKDEARLKVQLPHAQGEEAPAREPDGIRIAIDRAGTFYVDDRRVTDRRAATLMQALNGALGDHLGEHRMESLAEIRKLPVLIQADASTPHQAVMTALDAAAEVGLTRIAFGATRSPAAAALASGAAEASGGRADATAATAPAPAVELAPLALPPRTPGAAAAGRSASATGASAPAPVTVPIGGAVAPARPGAGRSGAEVERIPLPPASAPAPTPAPDAYR